MKHLYRLLFSASAVVALLSSACTEPKMRPGRAQESIHVRFGMPAPANASLANRENYLIERPQYVLSYHAEKHIPNWVGWCLRHDDLGKAKRGAFEPDPLLPAVFTRVTTHVYDGCGFDRGHMCPAQDRSARQEDMDATFYLTNVLPQSPNCNRKAWERLESYCRDLTKNGQTLWICCGPSGVGGKGEKGPKQEIGKGIAVTVPAKLWKVILVLPSPDAEPRRDTRTIAVVMPNDQSVDYDWPRYRVSVRDVEKLTGYTFFPNLPQDVASAIKDRKDEVRVHVPKPSYGN